MKKLPKCGFLSFIQLEKACASEVYRPALNCVHFQDGYAYASDGCILVKAKIDQICNLPKEMQDKLEGKNLWKDSYKEIRNADKITNIDEDGITYEDFQRKVKVDFYEASYPSNVNDIINIKEFKEIDKICFNPKYIKLLSYIFPFFDDVTFNFTGVDKPIFIKCSYEFDISAIIMPRLIKEE